MRCLRGPDRVAALSGLVLCMLHLGCEDSTGSPPSPAVDEPFVDRALAVGLDFRHFNGMSGELYVMETMGPGGALFDFDNDGDLDAYLVQGHFLSPGPFERNPAHRDRLYRNELVESGVLRFVDVTEQAGIESTGYGMGVAAGDYDGDGHVDLYVTNLGPNLLLRNNGDGTFRDVTEASGAVDARWSASAAFVDYDGDGRLDLFVTNYVDLTFDNHRVCYSKSRAQDYCSPQAYNPLPDRLFRNRGDGTFENVTARAQIAREFGAGLGVLTSDFNRDGRVDIYVANDADPNQLWINQGDGTFRNEALLAGCALNEQGRKEASMGVDGGDFDGDGDEDLFVTHLIDETNTLYLNDGAGFFEDHTSESGLGPASRPFTGFGTGWIDYDNNGWLDLIVVNGAVKLLEEPSRAGDPYPLHETNQLFRNLGRGRFEEISDRAGAAFRLSRVSRGMALGDVDNDGDVDLLILNNNGPATLLVNRVGQLNGWVGLRMMDPSGTFDVIGTRVEVVRQDGSSNWRTVRVAASYCSSNDPRLLFGLGGDGLAGVVRAHWPDGMVEQWNAIEIARYTTLRQGSGEEVSP